MINKITDNMDFILTRNRFCPYITAKEIMGWILYPGILEYYFLLIMGYITSERFGFVKKLSSSEHLADWPEETRYFRRILGFSLTE